MNDIRKVLQNLIGARILQIRVHSSSPTETLYGITITTADGYEATIGFPDVDQNITVWDGGCGDTSGEVIK